MGPFFLAQSLLAPIPRSAGRGQLLGAAFSGQLPDLGPVENGAAEPSPVAEALMAREPPDGGRRAAQRDRDGFDCCVVVSSLRLAANGGLIWTNTTSELHESKKADRITEFTKSQKTRFENRCLPPSGMAFPTSHSLDGRRDFWHLCIEVPSKYLATRRARALLTRVEPRLTHDPNWLSFAVLPEVERAMMRFNEGDSRILVGVLVEFRQALQNFPVVDAILWDDLAHGGRELLRSVIGRAPSPEGRHRQFGSMGSLWNDLVGLGSRCSSDSLARRHTGITAERRA